MTRRLLVRLDAMSAAWRKEEMAVFGRVLSAALLAKDRGEAAEVVVERGFGW